MTQRSRALFVFLFAGKNRCRPAISAWSGNDTRSRRAATGLERFNGSSRCSIQRDRNRQRPAASCQARHRCLSGSLHLPFLLLLTGQALARFWDEDEDPPGKNKLSMRDSTKLHCRSIFAPAKRLTHGFSERSVDSPDRKLDLRYSITLNRDNATWAGNAMRKDDNAPSGTCLAVRRAVSMPHSE